MRSTDHGKVGSLVQVLKVEKDPHLELNWYVLKIKEEDLSLDKD